MVSRVELGIRMSEMKGIKTTLSSMRTDKCVELLNHCMAHLKLIKHCVSKVEMPLPMHRRNMKMKTLFSNIFRSVKVKQCENNYTLVYFRATVHKFYWGLKASIRPF